MFSRVVWKWTHWSLAATLGWGALTVLGCHEEHDRAGTLAEEPATDPSQVGSLRLALVTRATSIYRLRDAVFTIQD